MTHVPLFIIQDLGVIHQIQDGGMCLGVIIETEELGIWVGDWDFILRLEFGNGNMDRD